MALLVEQGEDLTDKLVLLSCVGEGSSFRVYSAWYKEGNDYKKHVAVKFPKSPEFNERLIDEFNEHSRFFRAKCKVPQPIMRGMFSGKQVSVSEFCEGTTLYTMLIERKFSTKRLLTLVYDVIQELLSLKTSSLVHADVHLNNIIVKKDKSASKLEFMLVDFDMSNNLNAFYSLGKNKENLDVNQFIYSLVCHAPQYRNRSFAKSVKKLFSAHVRKLKFCIHRVPISEWMEETPCVVNGTKYTFSHLDDRGDVCFHDDVFSVGKPHCVADTDHYHIIYYFAHKKLVSYDSRPLKKAIENLG